MGFKKGAIGQLPASCWAGPLEEWGALGLNKSPGCPLLLPSAAALAKEEHKLMDDQGHGEFLRAMPLSQAKGDFKT